MNDYFGDKLNIGDEVVFMVINYRNFTRGIIKKSGNKKATIKYIKSERITYQFYNQLIKVPEGK